MNDENALFSCLTQQVTSTTNRSVDHFHGRTGLSRGALGRTEVILEIDEKQRRVCRREPRGKIAHQRPGNLESRSAYDIGQSGLELVAMRESKAAKAVDQEIWSLPYQEDAANPIRA